MPKVIGGLVGLVIGAELLVFGTQRVVSELGLSETVFGLLVIGAAVSFEEVVLEALPAFRGFPELSVGNALGTLVFLLTGSLGVIVLARPIDVPAQRHELPPARARADRAARRGHARPRTPRTRRRRGSCGRLRRLRGRSAGEVIAAMRFTRA
ncbi:MAG TPA: hypothetical protein VK631_16285 [Solirubrobacteraceae bacterium]|nr:hypothetical protein [Solirubrobacteraceae bacterium]